MGQSSSSQRQAQAVEGTSLTQSTQRYQELGEEHNARHGRDALLGGLDGEFRNISNRASSITRIGTVAARHPEYHSTYRRETRARSTLISANTGAEDGEVHGRDDVVLEQEERPLILRDMEVRLNDAPITDIQAAPMPRHASVLSRIGSRVSRRNDHPRNSNGDRLTNQTVPSSSATPRAPQQQASSTRRNRFSMFDLPTRGFSAALQNTRNRRSSFSTAFPTTEYSTDPEAVFPHDIPSQPDVLAPEIENTQDREEAPVSTVQRNRSIRRSWADPFSQLFRSSRSRQLRESPVSRRQELAADETTTLISPQGTGTDTSLDDSTTRPGRFGLGEVGTESNPVELDSPDRPTSWLSTSRDQAESSTSDGRRSARRMQQLLGGRSSRLIRREDDTPLSRVLQLAAAAIAAQLSGRSGSSPDLQSVGDDRFDGNLNAFIQSLNSAAEASAGTDDDSNMTELPPLNFWRVFRFVNSNTNNRDGRSGLNQDSNSERDNSTSRLVTLVVVGVRSVPSSSLLGDTAGTLNNNLDGILALPSTPPEGLNIGSGLNLDGMSTRNRLTRRRRTSFTGINPFPSQYESQRHQVNPGGRLNRTAALNPLRRSPSSSPHAAQARPPSPFPGGDQFSSQAPRRNNPSSFASTPSTSSSSRDTPPLDSAAANNRPDSPAVSPIRQRPRSESHGHLGSGAARRNGVVEPDGASGNGRHWLIYVVGTNLSEDHPAFQAPSLFTDNPSYEDMLMLSALLGPVKPPVASAQDVAGAQGVFRMELRRADGIWLARATERPQENVDASSSLAEMSREVERCLVCLTDYESGDEIRQLQNCDHVFHRECIDTWLTTGRNSCPLCRGQGVDEKAVSGPEGPRTAQVSSA